MAVALAMLLLTQEGIKLWYYIGVVGQPWQRSLPLDLCRINELLCAAMLLTRSRDIFRVAYFWAMAGSVAAMLTPDLAHGFPTPQFVLFFVGHGLVVLAVIHAVFGFGFTLTARDVGFALAVTGAYTALMALVNLLLDANYLFLREKPAQASVVDVLGPWPYYVLGLMAIAVAACWLVYLPFPLARRLRRR
jgi:hypothetical integral membrane protein (TIGR02206 family)